MRRMLVALALTLGPQIAHGQAGSGRFVATLSAVPAFSVSASAPAAFSGGLGAGLSTSFGSPRLALVLSSGLYRMQRPTYGGAWSRWHTIGYGSIELERRLLRSSSTDGISIGAGGGGYVSRSDTPGLDHELRFGYHAGIRHAKGRIVVDARYVRIGDGSLTALVPVSIGFRF